MGILYSGNINQYRPIIRNLFGGICSKLILGVAALFFHVESFMLSCLPSFITAILRIFVMLRSVRMRHVMQYEALSVICA